MTATNLGHPYQAHYKPNQLIRGTGQTAVITGWTVKQTVAKRLDPQEYAVVGQLYSPTRGISVLIRNLLANPHVHYLVILNATKEDENAGGSTCLIDFFRQGFRSGQSDTGRSCWVINSPIVGYIDSEIPADYLNRLRQVITWFEARTIAEAVTQVKMLAAKPQQPPWGTPMLFPQLETTPSVLPGPRYGHRIEGKTIAETWVQIIHRIKTTGTIRPTTYDGHWQELIDLMAIVTDEPPDFYIPDPNYLPCDRAFIREYIGQILDDSPQREGVKYTYGQRLRSWFGVDQIEQVISKLVADRDSARAVMSLWDVQDHDADSSPPCLNHIWVRIVENELSLTATFRSNDMFSAWPVNAIGLRALQQHIHQQIEMRSGQPLTLGPLITISQSAHIYDDCWENADRLIAQYYHSFMRERHYDDAIGSFIINIQDQQIIVVEHTTPGSGEVVKCYSGQSAKHLYRQMITDCPAIAASHAAYLGSELQKAETALRYPHLFSYEQDRSLVPLIERVSLTSS